MNNPSNHHYRYSNVNSYHKPHYNYQHNNTFNSRYQQQPPQISNFNDARFSGLNPLNLLTQSQQHLPFGSESQMNSQMQEIRNEPRKFKCQKHKGEILSRICSHADCMNNSIMCDMCTLEDKIHSTDHRDHLMSFEEFLDGADEAFSAHRTMFKEHEIMPEEFLNLIKFEEKNIRKYTNSVKHQKKILDEHSKNLIQIFTELCESKMNEIKAILDKQLEMYQKNFSFFSKKVQTFYDFTGVSIFNNEGYLCRDNMYHFYKNFKNSFELDNYLKDLKNQITKIKLFNDFITAEGKIPHKNIEPEIKQEFLKYTQLINTQGAFPPTLDNKYPPPHHGLAINIPLDQNSIKNCFNFYDSYNQLLKDIDKSFSGFIKNSSNVTVLEDITKTTFFTLYEDNGMFQSFNYLNGINTNSGSSSQHNSQNIENIIDKENIAPMMGSRDINSGKNSSEIRDFQVTVQNFYNLAAKAKTLHYFEPGSKSVYLLDLKSINQTPFAGHQNEAELDCIEFTQVNLNIDFTLPYNHSSIPTPDGKIFLTGGCEDGDFFNHTFELDSSKKILMARKPMQLKRCNHGIAMLNHNNIIVVGGFSPGLGAINTCEKYDIKNDTWNFLANTSKPVENMSLCNFEDKFIYKFGGQNDNTIERYNINCNIWESVNLNLDFTIGYSCESIQINHGQILVFGGYNQGNLDQCFLFNVQITKDEGQKEKMVESINGVDKMNLPDKLYFHCPKSVVIYKNSLYCCDYGKQKIIRFNGKEWSILN